jgi:hypothetical protein
MAVDNVGVLLKSFKVLIGIPRSTCYAVTY